MTCDDAILAATRQGVQAIILMGAPMIGCDLYDDDGILGAAVFATGQDAVKLLEFAHTLHTLEVYEAHGSQEKR